MEVGKETYFRCSCHLVGYAWKTVFGANNAVVERVKGKFYSLRKTVRIEVGIKSSRPAYITNIGHCCLGSELVIC